MRTLIKRLVKREDGQSLVEYALIIALVAIALVVGLGTLAGGITDTFDSIVTSL
ncbi:MAG TPA: Flp family type IVb pilin [Planctomycetota bacterium]|nr:Flp family type IVb pilin [Planctomycetota bacterium]